MGQPLGRWQLVLAAALSEHSAVGVRAVVEAHLGREPTRSERKSSRRAAHLLARGGGAKVLHVTVPASLHRKAGTYLVLVQTDLDVRHWPNEASMQAIATKPLPLAGPSREALASVVSSLRTAAAGLDHVEVGTIDGETAGQALDAIAEPLRQLTGLQRRLTLRRELRR